MFLDISEILALFVAAILLLYYYGTSTFDFWKSRGVNGPKPQAYFGNTKDTYFGKTSVNDVLTKVYFEYKDEPMVGIFGGRNPMLVIRDPELIKLILIKDFTKFADRAMPPEPEVEPLSEHLFRIEVEKWRPMRTHLSPVFTSGKLKEMFHLMLECSHHFETYIADQVAMDQVVECTEVAARFTTDVIGSCAFGIETNALAVEDSEFRRMGQKIFRANWKSMIRDRLRQTPFLLRMLARFIAETSFTDFFINITKEAIDYRIKNNVHRHDFIEALVDLKKHPEKIGLDDVSYKYMASQSFVFFAAGFETSSLTISNALYEMARNHVLQEKLRNDILNVLRKNDGRITYESVSEMTYLQAFVDEVLRMYPPVLYLMRTATENYTFPGTKISLPKGQRVFIPSYAIHYDPEIYPEPEVFDPERFLGENAKNRHPMHYLPFGNGPRNCIGKRFAIYQSKVGIISIVKNYKIDVCEKTKIPYKLNPKTLFLLQPAHGIYVKMTKLKE